MSVSLLTSQDATGDSRDSLDLANVVVGEVIIAGGVQELWVTEGSPKLGGDRGISLLYGLGTNVKALRHKSSVPEHTHPIQDKVCMIMDALCPKGTFWIPKSSTYGKSGGSKDVLMTPA